MATIRPKVYVHMPAQFVTQAQETVRQVAAAESPNITAPRDTYKVKPRFVGNDFMYIPERSEPRTSAFQALIDWLFG